MINKPSLTADISNDYEGLSINDVVLDSISCQLRDREQNLIKHKFDEDEDEIIFESRHGNSLDFTKQEFAIMEFLMKHPNQVYSKQELYELTWDECCIGEDKSLNVYISNIKKKLKQYSEREYIETVWGIGYRLAVH